MLRAGGEDGECVPGECACGRVSEREGCEE